MGTQSVLQIVLFEASSTNPGGQEPHLVVTI